MKERISILLVFIIVCSFAQAKKVGNIEINDEIILACTSVKNQGNTGTCWSFATTSFIESELIRMGKGEFDLSEMYFVAKTYENKVKQYLFYHGENNFSEGGQAHDVMNVIRENGLVNNESYPGKLMDERFSHHDLVNNLSKEAETVNKKTRKFAFDTEKITKPILTRHIGKFPKNFTFEGTTFTAKAFQDFLGFDPNAYIEITSYEHHPFYSQFVLEIPDNWAHAPYYNVPIEELMQTIRNAIRKGFTVCWDGDNSEKSFEFKKGIADLPENEIGNVDQKQRQETFLNRETTDDHLMHIVGLAKDENNRRYFYTKNSWGESSNPLNGFLYMSEDYVKLKTIAILVHKKAVPDEIAKKLNLK